MAFTAFIETQNIGDVAGWIAAVGDVIHNHAGWTDDGGDKYHSAADAQGRICYVKFESVNAVGVDYVKVTLASDSAFTLNTLLGYAFCKSTDAYNHDIRIYANEYWFWVTHSIDSLTIPTYAFAAGMYYTARTITQQTAPFFIATPRETAVPGVVEVKFNDFTQWLISGGSGEAQHEGGLFGLETNAIPIGTDDLTIPQIRKGGVARLCFSNGVTGFTYGRLYYAYMMPFAGVGGDVDGTTYNDLNNAGQFYYGLIVNAPGNHNLIVRTI